MNITHRWLKSLRPRTASASVVGRQQQQFAATVFDQPRLAGNGEFFFIRRADHADPLENEFGHLDETLSAEPRQTACW